MTERSTGAALPLTGASWRREVGSVPEAGLGFDIEALEGERAALAAALGLVGLDELRFTGRLRPLSRGRIALEARLAARAWQRCVVTLDPVEAVIDEALEIELWPEEVLGAGAREVEVGLEEDAPEPIANGVVDLGRIAYETLAIALPLYPRSAEAGEDASVLEPRPASPFAVLERLKKPT